MYGTIARFRLKSGMEGRLAQELRLIEEVNVPGFIKTGVYRMDRDPREYYLVTMFENKEAYMANADSPEQDARYRQMAQLFEDEPDWNDGEIIYISP